MIKLLGKIPRKVGIAFSGGVDSVSVASFLMKGRHDIALFYFNHMTDFGIESESFCKSFAKKNNIPLFSEKLDSYCPKHMSLEEFWRTERYKFLNKHDVEIITCHHLDDQIENWIFSSLHGNSRLIPYKNKNIIRPFLLARKDELRAFCEMNKEDWMEDPSNQNTDFMRNFIRKNIVESALVVNPGLPKVLRKKITSEFEEKNNELCNC